MASRPSTTFRTSFAFRPYWGLRDFEVPASVWGGDPDCRHRCGETQRGRRKDMLPTESTKRRARVSLTRLQDMAATSGGRFCERCGAWLGSLGLESSPELFVVHMVEVMRDVRRVLKPTGTLWLNLGDSFYGGSRTARIAAGELKPKDLIGIPWEVALAMRRDGWYLRSDLVWSKPNLLCPSHACCWWTLSTDSVAVVMGGGRGGRVEQPVDLWKGPRPPSRLRQAAAARPPEAPWTSCSGDTLPSSPVPPAVAGRSS